MREMIVTSINSTVPTEVHGSNTRIVGDVDIKLGAVLPGYKDIIAIGHDATTSYSSTRSKITPGYGVVSYVDSRRPSDYYSESNAFIGNLPGFNSSLLSQATATHSNFVSRRKVSSVESVSGGVILGELGQTIHQLAHPFKGFMDLTKNYLNNAATIRAKVAALASEKGWKSIPHIPPSVLNRNQQINIRHLNKELNNAYLEYTYAVQPTMMDIEAVSRELSSKHLSHEEPFNAYGVADGHFGGLEGDIAFGFSAPNWYHYRSYYEVAQVKSFAKILIDMANNLNLTYGLDPRQFVPTVWELIPYSFIADYVSNISDVINGFCYPDPSCRYGYSNTKQWIYGNWALSGEVRPGESRKDWNISIPPSYFEITKLTRSGFNWDPPRLILEAPSLKQTINMASLFLARLL